MGHSSRLDRLRRILSGGMRDPHDERQSPDFRNSEEDAPDHNARSESAPGASSAPSQDARTDPARGTGELGEESRDPGQLLNEELG